MQSTLSGWVRWAALGLGALVIASSACALEASGLDGASSSASSASSSASTGSSGGTGGAPSSSSSAASSSSASSSSGGFVDPCPPGSTAEFQDDFNDNATAVSWARFANGNGFQVVVQEEGGQLAVQTDGTVNLFGGYYWIGKPPTRSLRDCHAFIEVPSIMSPDTKLFVAFELVDDSETPNTSDLSKRKSLTIAYLDNQMHFSVKVAGVIQNTEMPIPYDPIAHRWWGFRESQGTTYFMTSPDGKSWTNQLSVETPSFASIVRANIAAGAIRPTAAGSVVFDNLNITPP